MSRVSLLGVSGVLACLVFAPAARSAPTTQPAPERAVRFPIRVEYKVAEPVVVSQVDGLRGILIIPTTQPMQVVPRAWPYLRVGPQTEAVPQDWLLRNRNSNTWHYLVPVGSQF